MSMKTTLINRKKILCKAIDYNVFFKSLPLFLKKASCDFGIVLARRMEGHKEGDYTTYFWAFLAIFKSGKMLFIHADISCPPYIFPDMTEGNIKKFKELTPLRRYRWEVIGGGKITGSGFETMKAVVGKHPANGKESPANANTTQSWLDQLFTSCGILKTCMTKLKNRKFSKWNHLRDLFQEIFGVQVKPITDKCTYDLKKKPFPQAIYKCRTCFPHDKVYGVVCEYCAKKHHKGHDLKMVGDFIVSKCDCGLMKHLKSCTNPLHILQPNYTIKQKKKTIEQKKLKKSVCWFCNKTKEFKKTPKFQGWKHFECGIN